MLGNLGANAQGSLNADANVSADAGASANLSAGASTNLSAGGGFDAALNAAANIATSAATSFAASASSSFAASFSAGVSTRVNLSAGAQTASVGKHVPDPWLSFAFVVDIQGIGILGFNSCNELGFTSDANRAATGVLTGLGAMLPSRTPSWKPLVLGRGMAFDSVKLWRWVLDTVTKYPLEPHNITLSLMAQPGQIGMQLTFQRAYPTTWSITGLSMDNKVLIDKITFAYEKIILDFEGSHYSSDMTTQSQNQNSNTSNHSQNQNSNTANQHQNQNSSNPNTQANRGNQPSGAGNGSGNSPSNSQANSGPQGGNSGSGSGNSPGSTSGGPGGSGPANGNSGGQN